MKTTLASVFADAGALFRANADLLVRVAGVFYFLPVLAVALFVSTPPPLPRDATMDQIVQTTLDYWSADGNWMLWGGGALVSVYGSCLLLTLLLAIDRPTVGTAMARALRVMPTYLLASLLRSLLAALGIFALVIPGLYIIGRTFLTGAVVVAEPQRGATDALRRAVHASRGHGWMLFGCALLMYFVSQFAASAIGAGGAALNGDGTGGQILNLLLNLVAAALAGAVALAEVLLEAAAYRRLTLPDSAPGKGPSNGI